MMEPSPEGQTLAEADSRVKTENSVRKGKQQVTYKGNPLCLTADFSAENSAGQKAMTGYI